MKRNLLVLIALISSFNVFAERTILSGSFTDKSKERIILSYYADVFGLLENTKEYLESWVDTNGNFKIILDIDQPVSINVMKGDARLFYNVYICPKDSVYMAYSETKIDMSGPGSDRIGFMFDFQDHFYRNKSIPRKPPENSSPIEFMEFFNERRLAKLEYLEDYFIDTVVSNEFREIVDFEINYRYGIRFAQYGWSEEHSEKYIYENPAFYAELKNIIVDCPAALISDDYIHFIKVLPNGIFISHMEDADSEGVKSSYYIRNQYEIRDSIAKRHFTGVVYDCALYQILNSSISRLNRFIGRGDFEKEFESVQKSLELLGESFSDKCFYDRLFNRLMAYKEETSIAPNFMAYDEDGKEVKLSDFLGKVVYVDFWATNCSPCVAELPATKMLQETFREETRLIFLYVSFDSDPIKARAFIERNNFSGTHLFCPKGFNSEVAITYNIVGIPRYILVGKDGKLINVDAPRPQDGVDEMIKRQLGNF